METKYVPLPPHTPQPEFAADVAEYLSSLDDRHRRLHEMAVTGLGSSYFVERSHGFLNWKKKRAAAAAAPK